MKNLKILLSPFYYVIQFVSQIIFVLIVLGIFLLIILGIPAFCINQILLSNYWWILGLIGWLYIFGISLIISKDI